MADEDDFVARLSDTLLTLARSAARERTDEVRYSDQYLAIDHALEYRSPPRADGLNELLEVRPVIGDVELSVARFARQDQLLDAYGFPTPVAEVGEHFVPVDLGIDQWADALPRDIEDSLDSFVHDTRSLRTALVEPQQAEKGLTRGLRRFLKTRLFAGDSGIQEPPAAAGGYVFEVTTKSPGLRVHYSPAYFLNARLAFGGPSTPVHSRLLPGRYVFGAYPPTSGYWSSAEYDIPGPTHVAHLEV